MADTSQVLAVAMKGVGVGAEGVFCETGPIQEFQVKGPRTLRRPETLTDRQTHVISCIHRDSLPSCWTTP